jgi:hypothetical protein
MLSSSHGWRILISLAATASVFISTLLVLLNVPFGLMLVTVGPFTLERVVDIERLGSLFLQAEHLRPFFVPIALVAGCAAGIVVLLRSHQVSHSARSASHYTLFWLSTAAGAAVLAFSYRFAGLFMVPLALWFHMRYLRGSASGRQACVAWGLALVVSVLPVDLSLQLVEAPPHFAPASSGLFTGSAEEHARRGEFVMVGGCVAWYYEPRWIWVW